VIHNVIGRGLLLFWGAWFTAVFASNLADGLKAAGALPAAWPFASGNFELIAGAIAIYSGGPALTALLFAGVVAIQLAAAVLFWRAALDDEAATRGHDPAIRRAFLAAIGLFAAFLLADEAFVVYERMPGVGATHWLVLCALLLSYLVIHVRGGAAPPGSTSARRADVG